MIKTLAIEWLKIRKYRTFWILACLFAVLLPLWNLFISKGIMKFTGDINIMSQLYYFSSIWQNLGFWTSIFVVFISVLTIILTTNEYQFKTNRQNVLDGWTRIQFYHGKWMLAIVFSLLTTLYVFIVGVLFASSYGSINDFPGHIEYLFYVFVLALNYYGFALLLAVLLKRSGITIGLFFLYCLILENMLRFGLNRLADGSPGDLLPLQCSDELLPFPLPDIAKHAANITDAFPASVFVAVSIGWIILYYVFGRLKLMRSDW